MEGKNTSSSSRSSVFSPGGEGLAGLGGAVRRRVTGTSAHLLHRPVCGFTSVCGQRAVVQRVYVEPGNHTHMDAAKLNAFLTDQINWDVQSTANPGLELSLIPTWQHCEQRTDNPQEHPSLGFPHLGIPLPSWRQKKFEIIDKLLWKHRPREERSGRLTQYDWSSGRSPAPSGSEWIPGHVS